MIDSLILVAACELQKFGINILEMFDIKKKKISICIKQKHVCLFTTSLILIFNKVSISL